MATLIAVAVTVIQLHYNLEKYTLTPAPFTIIGVATSIFLGFRNHTAYNRFREGRVLGGGPVNASRSFTRPCFSQMISHLRGQPSVPDALLPPMGVRLQQARRQGRVITGFSVVQV